MATRISILLAVLMVLASCSHRKSREELADSGRTVRTEALLRHLTTQAAKGYMIGHEDATLYGIGWSGDSARSDIQSVCGDMPAMVSFNICGLETTRQRNLGAVPVAFDAIRRAVIDHFGKGGVVTLTWSPDHLDADQRLPEASADSLAAFLQSLRSPYGYAVPVLLNAFGSDTWTACSENHDAYVAFCKDLRKALDKRDVHNVIYVFDYVAPWNESRYPGDELVDVLSVNCTADTTAAAADGESSDKITAIGYKEKLEAALSELQQQGKTHQKPYAISRAGIRRIPSKTLWTGVLAPALDASGVSYVVFGSNSGPEDFCAPYPGQESVSNFVSFYNNKRTLFLHDVNGLYLRQN